MELEDYVTLRVKTFDETTSFEVSVQLRSNGKLLAEEVFHKACKQYGLKKESCFMFGLFEGHCNPIAKVKFTDHLVPPYPELSLQRWCFGSRCDVDKWREDKAAVRLLYFQARHDVTTGQCNVPKRVLQALQECDCDAVDSQCRYLSLCASLPDFPTTVFHACLLQAGLVLTEEITLERGVEICLGVSKQAITISQSGRTEWLSMPWCHIKKWQCCVKGKGFGIHYARMLSSGKCSVFEAQITTKQAPFLLSMVMEITRQLLKQQGGEHVYFAGQGTVRRDNGWQDWENLLYDVTVEMGVSNNGFIPDTA